MMESIKAMQEKKMKQLRDLRACCRDHDQYTEALILIEKDGYDIEHITRFVAMGYDPGNPYHRRLVHLPSELLAIAQTFKK